MKYLKIEDNKAFFLREQSEWMEIDKITKDDLFYLLNKAVSDDFEIDDFEEHLLGNKAHQIIYRSLSTKFTELLSNKTRFKDESENLYKDALAKYSLQDQTS